ncbi:Regulatory protein AfsR [Beauveria bassiana]|nr:Regulatory protein AfsR [Beauveria bassiana]KAH8715306.1 Regulatory protein AfsR [Beauveria bassiana]
MTTPLAELRAPRRTARDDFEIAVICALALEADAVDALFDHCWDEDDAPLDKAPGDSNAYTTGAIGRHNVVLAHMPGMGKVSAAAVANNCRMSFPNIKLALVVGIAGVVPFGPDNEEIILGDVIISDGVIQYDLGRQLPGRFVRKDTLLDTLGRPNVEIRSMMAKLKMRRGRKQLANGMKEYLDALRLEPELAAEYPGTAHDILFEATYRHIGDKEVCDQSGCNGNVITRNRTHTVGNPVPAIHLGLIASGDSVIKSGEDRDRIAKEEGVIAFEMESAGVWDTLPCVVIKGACDYADSHKNKRWQRYAAATAAACMKVFLKNWVPSRLPKLSLNPQLKVDEAIEVTDGTHPPCYHIQLAKNPRFTGRTFVLNKLEKKFFSNDCSQKVALVGLGGVGKTQVALHFAYKLKEKRPEYSIFWVPLLSDGSAEQAFVEIAKKLGLPQKSNDDDVKTLVCQRLGSDRAGKWLFVIDNADDRSLVSGSMKKPGLEDYFPAGENGILLMTTRSGHVAEEFAGPDVIEVEQMDQKETDLFREHLTQKKQLQEKAIVARLLNYLTFLPLAITQAASYLNQTKAPIEKYLTLLQEAEKDLPCVLGREFKDTTRYKGSQNAVGKTWLVSFQQIKQSEPVAVRLLSFLSCIEPKAIPQAMVPDAGSETMEWAVGTLCAYSFLARQEQSDVFDMHSLVHMATREWVTEQGWSDEVTRNAVSHLRQSFPSNTDANREIRRKYLPHATRLLKQDIEKWSSDAYCLAEQVGMCHDTERRFKEAVMFYGFVCRWKQARLAETESDLLDSEHALACAYLDDRRIKDAIEILERVVAVRKVTLDKKDHSRLESEHELARAYLNDRRIKDAIEIFERVVAVQKVTLDEKDHDRLVSEYSLARAYLDDGRIKDAIEIFEHVVAVQKATLDEKDHDRLTSEYSLASAYLDDGRIKNAIEILEHVVAVRKVTLDEKDRSRLMSEHRLARAYQARG